MRAMRYESGVCAMSREQGHNDVIAKKIVCVVTLTGVGFKVLCL